MAPIRVLVVDDSAFARKVLREVLSSSPEIDVLGAARDGLEALEKIADLKPDVITLDLVMPNLDGLGVLAALLPGGPRAVVVSMAGEESALGLAALEAGAVEVVHKPTALATDRLYELRAELIAAVRSAAVAHPRPLGDLPARPASALARPRAANRQLIVVGASTGGPQALTRLVKALPASLPVPMAIVLHLPAGYTETFANRLDRDCALQVEEARDGAALAPGLVTVARAGMHLRLDRSPTGELVASLDLRPTEKPHRPSVDVLFESAARLLGAGVLGVVLTGMGDDGLLGARAIHAAGGQVLTETEASCVVYGMPRCVDEAGLSAGSAAIDAMAEAILSRL